MRKHFLTFLVIALLGCKSDKLPEGIIPVETMASILVDVHLAEGKIQELRLRGDTAETALRYYEELTFEKHNVVREDYQRSFNYHLSDLKTMDAIYAIVIDSLNVRRQLNRIN